MLVRQAFGRPLPFPHFVRLLANRFFATGIGGRLIPGALMPLFQVRIGWTLYLLLWPLVSEVTGSLGLI
jgi:hypothetical protein